MVEALADRGSGVELLDCRAPRLRRGTLEAILELEAKLLVLPADLEGRRGRVVHWLGRRSSRNRGRGVQVLRSGAAPEVPRPP